MSKYVSLALILKYVFIPPADDLGDFVIDALRPSESESSRAICEEVGPAFKLYEKKLIRCRPDTIGSILRIRKNKPGRLSLCEVEVFGGITTLTVF